jgi:hypothetical protein
MASTNAIRKRLELELYVAGFLKEWVTEHVPEGLLLVKGRDLGMPSQSASADELERRIQEVEAFTNTLAIIGAHRVPEAFSQLADAHGGMLIHLRLKRKEIDEILAVESAVYRGFELLESLEKDDRAGDAEETDQQVEEPGLVQRH